MNALVHTVEQSEEYQKFCITYSFLKQTYESCVTKTCMMVIGYN